MQTRHKLVLTSFIAEIIQVLDTTVKHLDAGDSFIDRGKMAVLYYWQLAEA